MEWSGQQGSAPQSGTPQGQQPYNGGAVPASGYYQPGAQQVPQNVQPGVQMPQAPMAAQNPLVTPMQAGIHPVGAPAAMSGSVTGMPPMAQQPAAVGLDDSVPDANDTEWVNRAKRAVRSTQGDPHRQVQLIQHLRSQYLKQRYGRSVHTDEA